MVPHGRGRRRCSRGMICPRFSSTRWPGVWFVGLAVCWSMGHLLVDGTSVGWPGGDGVQRELAVVVSGALFVVTLRLAVNFEIAADPSCDDSLILV